MQHGFISVLIRNRTIRSILAAALLALFALGISPKIAIHALVARHSDTHLSLAYGHSDQYNTAGFHCSTDNLVVELPFVHHLPVLQKEPEPFFPVHGCTLLEEPLSSIHLLFGLRGPPAFFLSC